MPYIEHGRRDCVRPALRPERPRTPGELNFAVTSMLIQFWLDRGPSYQAINDIVGALECAKLEFSRRVVSGYEDSKIAQNGDVYP